MNELLNERIIAATKLLFLTTFKAEVEAGSPYILENDSDGDWDTSGVISITGTLSGLIAVRFKKNLPEAMLRKTKLIDSHSALHDRLINDMVGELINVITGNTFSDARFGEIMLSIPVTIRGRNHILSWSREPRINVIPFHLGNEVFIVETELKKVIE